MRVTAVVMLNPGSLSGNGENLGRDTTLRVLRKLFEGTSYNPFVDADGDGSWELDPNRIFHFGFSAGAMHGTMFLALDPRVSIAVESVAGGMSPEHSRWSPVRRPVLGTSLQARTPSLNNSPGITAIDGVPVGAPHFNENKPLRNLPAVVNTIAGAMDIQKAFEMHEWGQLSGQNPIVWAPYIRSRPLAGLYAKSVIYQFAESDQQANNPGTTALLRAGDLADWALHYRHDLAFAEDPAIPKNPHMVVVSPTHPNATFRSISRALQDQIAAFLHQTALSSFTQSLRASLRCLSWDRSPKY